MGRPDRAAPPKPLPKCDAFTRLPRQLVSVVLGLGALAALWFLLAPAALGGPTNFVVTAGTSMEPRLHTGDLAIVRSAAEYLVGDIVAYRSRTLNTTVLHRIIAKGGGRYLFRGDKNDFVDPERPEQSQLVGKLWIHVPGGGRYFAWITSAWTIGALAGIAALTLLGRTTSQRRQRRRKEPAVALSRPTLQNAVAGAAAALVLSLGFGVVAFSRAERHVVAAPVSYQASGSFSYTAGTALGDVYPRGRVAAGDPVFFQVVHSLRVRFDYSFAAARAHRLQGTLGLVARHQASNGWTRTFPLAPPRRFAGDRARVLGLLDLDGLPGLIRHVEDTTRVDNLTYTLSFLPRVRAAGVLEGVPFRVGGLSPKLTFVLTPDQLQLAPPDGSANPLRPKKSGSVPVRGSVSSDLALGVATVPVATARRTAELCAFLALAALIVLAVLLDEAPRQSEQERIRARYRDPLVRVAGAGPLVEIADDGNAGEARRTL